MNHDRQLELFDGFEAFHNNLDDGPGHAEGTQHEEATQQGETLQDIHRRMDEEIQQAIIQMQHDDAHSVVTADWGDEQGTSSEGYKNLELLADRAKDSTLAWWMARYLYEATAGQSRHTKVAKIRDLEAFWDFFVEINGHGEIRQWRLRDTQMFIEQLTAKKRAPASINRVFATVRHFARWLQIHEDDPLKGLPLPTRGIKSIPIDEPDCKKIEPNDMHALFKAADELMLLSTRDPRARPKRNKAMMAVLFYTGIRVSEMTAIALDQLQQSHLVRVARKGRGRYKNIYLPKKCREAIEDYLAHERPLEQNHPQTPLFAAAKSGEPVQRQDVARALTRIAQMASRHKEEPIHLHPHRLRHTFGAAYRDRTGSDAETAQALGHAGMNYVGRYVRKTDAERQEDVERMYDRF